MMWNFIVAGFLFLLPGLWMLAKRKWVLGLMLAGLGLVSFLLYGIIVYLYPYKALF